MYFLGNLSKSDRINLERKKCDQNTEEKNVKIYNKIRCTAFSDSKIAFTQKDHNPPPPPVPRVMKNEKEEKILQENISEMDQFKLSVEQEFSYSSERDSLCSNMDLLEDEEGEESGEVVDSEKSKELQNLISSLSEIPELNCEEERKEMDNVKPLVIPDSQVSLDSICGLNPVKETLLNIFIYPIIYPHFFPVKIRWSQILLYGPPGTGKTMLARAIATEINATLHRISSADLLSHWQGETEKQIRILFEEIRTTPEPTVLFFDEIDGLCRRRTNLEDDNIRRYYKPACEELIKTELLTQFDDFVREPISQSYIIGATNCPWEIDCGFMRRFHKKIFVPLPDKEARLSILRKSLENIETDLTDSEWNEIGRSTEGYTGSDLVNIAMMSCCERFMQTKKCKYWETKGDLWIPATSHSLFLTRMNFEDIPQDKLGCRNIILADLQAAIKNTPKSVTPEEMFKYLDYSAKIK